MKRTFVIIACAVMAISAFAQDIDQKILKLQKATYTMPFSEVKVMPKLKKETTKVGTLEWRSPDYLRMDFTAPEGDYNLIEGLNFSVCIKGAVQKLPAKDTNSKTGVSHYEESREPMLVSLVFIKEPQEVNFLL